MKDKITLKDKLVDFLINNPSELKEIYEKFKGETKTTIRGRINENIDKAFKRLSKGVYVAIKGDSKALIIEGDVWEVIKEFEDSSMDAIITDSPYTTIDQYFGLGTTKRQKTGWNFETKNIDRPLLKEMYRVLKPGGHFFSFHPSDSKDTLTHNSEMILNSVKEGFEFNKKWIWDKKWMSMGYNGRNRHEQIFFFSKGKRNKPHDLRIPDVLTHTRIHPSKKLHDTEKPVELIKDIVKFCSKEGDTILDMFAGSLVLAQAGLELNRNTISVELDGQMIKESMKARGIQ